MKVKHTSNTTKKHHQFLLVDSAGNQHHAATAEDHGDAHYAYHAAESFKATYGDLPANSRKDLIIWWASCG
jgi:hypothetical protein